MIERLRSRPLAVLPVCIALLQPGMILAEPIAVRHPEGLVHGFLVLRTLEGNILADGDLIQVARGDRVTSQLVFHFKDGSLYDETVVYSQRRYFRVLSDHIVQKGPVFQHPMEFSINGSTGQVTANYTGDDGKEKVASDRLKLAPDLANGLILTLLKNIGPDAQQATVSMVAATPKPRVVKLAIEAQGEETFSIGSTKRRAIHYVLKIEIGGVAGLVAPLLGKEPPDIHAWILSGEAPALVRWEGPLYFGGPIWRIELACPVWPRVQPQIRRTDSRAGREVRSRSLGVIESRVAELESVDGIGPKRRERIAHACALQAIDEDANFAENVNQLILFAFNRTAVTFNHSRGEEKIDARKKTFAGR